MRVSLLLACGALLFASFHGSAQTPAERQRLYQIFSKKGINLNAAQLAQVEMKLREKGMTLDQFEGFMLKGVLPGKSLKAPLTAPLVEPAIVAKLYLSLQQRSAGGKLVREFEAKNKALVDKIPEPTLGDDIRANIEAKIREGLGKGAPPPVPEFQQSLELRKEYEEKFEALLNDRQKKIMDDYRVKQAEGLLTGGK